MAITTDVKFFHSTMAGAPVMSGTAGSMIAVLDACLVDGFNLKSVSGISVASGIATATLASGHGFIADQVVLVAGATPSALNGEQRVVSVTATTVVFEADGVADGTASGSITMKTAPLGWGKVFSGTNKAAYRSNAVDGTRLFLRVDDTNALYAAVSGYEGMTDVDTGTAQFGTYYWLKSEQSNASARPWTLVGDAAFFYDAMLWHAGGYPTHATVGFFGDFIKYASADSYCCIVSGSTVASNSYPGQNNLSAYLGASHDSRLARRFDQTGGAIKPVLQGCGLQSNAIGYTGFAYPNPADNTLLLHAPVLIQETAAANAARGQLPGLYQPLHDGSVLPVHGTMFTSPTVPGRKLMLLSSATSISRAAIVLDVTGPWR